MASRPDPRLGRPLLAAWLAGAFAMSALRDLGLLLVVAVLALVLIRRGLGRNLWPTARSVVPISAGLSLVSLAFLRLMDGAWPPMGPFAALALRTAVMGFASFSVLDRVDLMRALAPFPTLSPPRSSRSRPATRATSPTPCARGGFSAVHRRGRWAGAGRAR